MSVRICSHSSEEYERPAEAMIGMGAVIEAMADGIAAMCDVPIQSNLEALNLRVMDIEMIVGALENFVGHGVALCLSCSWQG